MRLDRWVSLSLAISLFGVLSCSSGSSGGPGNAAQSTCQGGLMSCNGLCVDVSTSAAQCGSCGRACGAGLVCSLGNCSNSCASGLMQCGSDCADTNSSAQHCGA